MHNSAKVRNNWTPAALWEVGVVEADGVAQSGITVFLYNAQRTSIV
jgi:hypothetical protein